MAANKGESKPQHTEEQKRAIVERVCELYETQNATVESCCEAAGISDRLFRLWAGQNSEFSERYKKAKANQDTHYWQDIIRPLTKTSLQRLLEGEETEDTEVRELSDKGIPTKDADGNVNTATTTKRSKTQPNATAVIFSLKGLYPDMFADRHKIESDITVNWHEEKTYAADNQTDEGAGLPSGQSDH